MTNLERFEEQFNKDYKDIYEFEDSVMDYPEKQVPYNGKLEGNFDNINHDSYGSEDSSLKRVYYFGDFDIYIEFYGTRCSYDGTTWNGYKEVIPVIKTITTFE